MSLFDKIKYRLNEQSNSGNGNKNVKFQSGAKGEFASGSASMGGEDKTYVQQGKKPLRGKNVKPGETTGTQTPKRGATTIRTSKQLNLFTGEVDKPKQVKVKSTYKTRVKKNKETSTPLFDNDKRSEAQKFTDKINKQNKNRKEYFKGRKAKRVPGASNEKPTGSISRGTYKSSVEGQKKYDAAKADIETKRLLKKAGASGDVSTTAPTSVRQRVTKIRQDRATKAGIPDPFTIDTSSAAADNAKRFGTPKPKSNVNISSKDAEVASLGYDPTKNNKKSNVKPNVSTVKPNVVKPLKDSERIKRNKVDTQKADSFKKTDAYKNVAQGKDSSGNYLTPNQRKANFINQTKQNKKIIKVNMNIISKSKDYDIEQLKKSGMYDDYKKIKDSTPKGGIPKWMKDFDKKYPNKVIKNPKRPDVVSIRGSASTNVTPTVKPNVNINKGYIEALRKTGNDPKKLGTFRKIRSLFKQIKNPLKTAKNLKRFRKRDIAKTVLGGGLVTYLAKKGVDNLTPAPAPPTKRYAPVYDKGTGKLRQFDPNKKSISAKEFNQKYTLKKPK